MSYHPFLLKFQDSTFTHCDVVNVAPSISASIGSFSPQKYVWKLLIGLHSGPRFLFLVLTRSFFKENLVVERLGIASKIQISTLIRVIILNTISNIDSWIVVDSDFKNIYISKYHFMQKVSYQLPPKNQYTHTYEILSP